MSFSSMHNDYLDPDRHLQSIDGTCFDKLEEEIKKLNQGRNLDCWPLCSFGWKDADLDPTGCTGIQELAEGGNEDFFYLKVGGHKALFPHEKTDEEETDTEMSDLDWCEHSIVCDFPYRCEWEDDRWAASFSEVVKCEWVYSEEDGDLDIPATAKKAVEECKKVCNKFSKACVETQKQLEQLKQ